ncbi:muconolactone Delta-isomerase family protein [Streptomonospora nanhaiensis]|uniref:muconolactone Delta-isomerase family protein n=1 Tax=Streptomonospora nanhaiensis TaxID=1323731 RepID=UPI001C999D12|nr:muconolactone Delta-isomerase family protein [Streptomonospora nanhaiensis]MBX9390300.1 muconolactone Delta-isomerase family protein [Streptomonospora nanhaiensis]
MLFEVVTKGNPAGISGAEFEDRFRRALRYMKDLHEKGAIVHAWVRVGGFGATNIFEVDSHAELLDYLNGSPMVPYVEYTVTPVVDGTRFGGLPPGAPADQAA